MISTQYINLNMVPSGVMPVLHCSQYDVGRPLGIVVYNGSESVSLSGYTCSIEATRTDGTAITAGVTTDGNIGVFTTTATMTNVPDIYKAQLVLTDGNGKRVASLPFVIRVVEAAMDENAESIEEDASLYEQYTGTVQTIIAAIRADLAAEITARQNAVSAEATARQNAITAEANARAAAVSAEAAARQSADNTLQSNINAEASTRATQDASLQSQIDQIIAPSGKAPSAAEVENARIGSDGTVYLTLGDAIRTQNSDLKSHFDDNVGQWYFKKAISSVRYPFIQLDTFGSRMYFKLITPNTDVVAVYVSGSSDGWQTQTQIYSQEVKDSGVEYYADIPNGFTSLRFAIAMPSAYSGNMEAIIHTVDNHTIAQNVINLWNKTNTIDQTIAENVYSISDVASGTNYTGFYLNTSPNQGIRSIGNTSFNLKKYPVSKNTTYYLYGKGVALNAALPVAAFGTAEVVDKNNYIEKIADGSATATDYFIKYIPDIDGYIYVAWISTKAELLVYDSESVSNAVNNILLKEMDNKSVKIQLFGDSITDNQWGDMSTWANYITQMMPGYNVTVVNDAVGGSGIGHGKSTTTSSHQSESYNYVWDLVTDGTTLQTDADAVVIFVGTNNWNSGTPVGNMESTGYTTIYGALKDIIDYISQHSAATVFVCTIPQRYNTSDQSKPTNADGEPLNSNDVSLADYCVPFEKVSAFYGMPCVHLNTALGWNRLNVSRFTTDGLHPNATGDKMLAKFICSEIMKYI